MNVKKRKMSPVATCVLVAVVLLVVLAIGMFTMVLPQKDTAASLAKEIETTQTQIVQARALAVQKPAQPIRVADMFKLVKAMPDDVDMTGIILQLNQTANDAGIEFDTIAPGMTSILTGYQTIPIGLTFNGNYYSLTDFLFRLRSLVAVRGGALASTGRLFTVNNLSFGAGVGGFPHILATISLTAYVYGTGAAPLTGSTGTGTTGATGPTGPAGTDTTATTPPATPVASGVTN
jgi:Tfp pilus assembly protein PilO